MKAIILAAGMGTRLVKYTENLPKGMLNFLGKPLIEWQIKILRSCGITDISIVTGYNGEKIQIPGVNYYHNKNFADTNMVETLFQAEKEMSGEILVCYSDIIYEKSVLEKAINSPAEKGVVVDADYWDYWQARLDEPEKDIESLVIDDKGKIIELGDSKCPKEKAGVRYVGLIKFSTAGTETLKNIYHWHRKKYFKTEEPWLRSKCFRKAYMTCMLQSIINAGYKVEPICISHGWLEFDTVDDYERATSWAKEGTLNRFINLN